MRRSDPPRATIDSSSRRLADKAIPLVLVVEDNPLNLAFFRDCLEAEGFAVAAAADGLSALERARERPPELVLMDVQLPAISGLEVTRWFKDDAALRAIPIIAVTAFAMRGDEQRALAAGCAAYLTKPIALARLIETVRRFLPAGAESNNPI